VLFQEHNKHSLTAAAPQWTLLQDAALPGSNSSKQQQKQTRLLVKCRLMQHVAQVNCTAQYVQSNALFVITVGCLRQ
jgi:hypothetical protein